METYDWEKHNHVHLYFRKGTLSLATFSFSSGSDQACVERTVLAASYSPFSLFPGECLGKERWPDEYKTWYRVHYSKQWHLINLKWKDKFQEKLIKCQRVWASLVAQWLRICLPMQGTRVRALAWEDPTCRGATGPVSHNY